MQCAKRRIREAMFNDKDGHRRQTQSDKNEVIASDCGEKEVERAADVKLNKEHAMCVIDCKIGISEAPGSGDKMRHVSGGGKSLVAKSRGGRSVGKILRCLKLIVMNREVEQEHQKLLMKERKILLCRGWTPEKRASMRQDAGRLMRKVWQDFR